MVNRGAQGRGFLKAMLARSSGRCRSGDSSVLSRVGKEEKVARCKANTHGHLWGRERQCVSERVSGHLEYGGCLNRQFPKQGVHTPLINLI